VRSGSKIGAGIAARRDKGQAAPRIQRRPMAAGGLSNPVGFPVRDCNHVFVARWQSSPRTDAVVRSV
jgi:hypothetical protein